jgi:hypothetical protein
MYENVVVEKYQAARDWPPGKQNSGDIAGFLVPAPEIHLRVHDEPEQRDRQLQEEDERRKPAKRSHRRILVEATRERK